MARSAAHTKKQPALAIRPATLSDAADLVILMDMAGHGLPASLWARRAADSHADSLLEIGRARLLSGQVSFSWRNAFVATADGNVVGMAMGFRQPDSFADDPATAEPAFRPLIELEAYTASSWYLNALAVYAEHRGRGVASSLIGRTLEIAADVGCAGVTLIAEDSNENALALYRRHGFEDIARRPFVPFGRPSATQNWVLMGRKVK